MAAPSSPAKVSLDKPPAATVAGTQFNIAASVPEPFTASSDADRAATPSMAAAPSEEVRAHSSLRTLVWALARQAAREQAAELTAQDRAAASAAQGRP
jgi:hypothetical protein